MFKSYKLRNYNLKLVIIVILLSIIGVMMIGSAQESLQQKQFYGVVAGTVIMLALSFFNYSFILKFYILIYLLDLGLLLSVLLMGESHGGAQRWLEIGGLQFQPSETAKIMLILFFAQFIMKYREKLNTVKILGACIILVGIPWLLIFSQPDLSTSVVVLVIFCIILFAGGLSFKIIMTAVLIAVPMLAILITLALQPDSSILKGFQENRIMAFLHPDEYKNDEALQQLNSIMAIGSGMLDGKGYKNNEITSVKNGNFILEAQTDFIFAVIGEEFGFKGCIAVICLIFFAALECLSIARRAKDLAGTIIAAGIGGLIAFQGFFNMGVATFILPNTGLPLPFVSYGLTSLLSMYIGIGIVLNIGLQSKKITSGFQAD